MTETTVRPDLLQPFQILTKLILHAVRQHLRVLAINNIPLSVQEPSRDFVLCWILDDSDNSFELFRRDLTRPTNNQTLNSAITKMLERTVCSNQHQLFCRPSWNNDGQHP